VPRLALNGDGVAPPAASSSSSSSLSPSIEKALAKKSLFKRPVNCFQQQTRPSLASQQSIQGLNAAGKRVLIVDDNSFNRNLLFHQLIKLGVSKIDQAGSGQEAVEIFIPGTHALVLMDLKMPNMDGFEATASIRQKELAHWGPAAVQRSIKSWPEASNLESDPWSPERFVAAPELPERRSNCSGSSVNDKQTADLKAQSDVVKSATVIAVTADFSAEIGEDRERAVTSGFDDVMVVSILLVHSPLFDQYHSCVVLLLLIMITNYMALFFFIETHLAAFAFGPFGALHGLPQLRTRPLVRIVSWTIFFFMSTRRLSLLFSLSMPVHYYLFFFSLLSSFLEVCNCTTIFLPIFFFFY
jgi:CheY-like chemotaxis protein